MKKLWFKAKWYGWGWYPSSWEGWAVIAAYIAALFYLLRDVETVARGTWEALAELTLPIAILTALLIAICYKTGEKPGWRWGPPKPDTHEPPPTHP